MISKKATILKNELSHRGFGQGGILKPKNRATILKKATIYKIKKKSTTLKNDLSHRGFGQGGILKPKKMFPPAAAEGDDVGLDF